MRWVIRAAGVIFILYLSLSAYIAGFAEYFSPGELPTEATVVVLSAGQRAGGAIGPNTERRLLAGVRLLDGAPDRRLLVTGGLIRDGEIAVARAMAQAAEARGVDAARILIEPRAGSTLDNAQYSFALLGSDPAVPIILVTQRFHLPRSWASFRWAGFRDIHLYPADTPDQHWRQFGARMIFKEAFKTPANLIRATYRDLADRVGGALPAAQ